jgi:hypothetical protein
MIQKFTSFVILLTMSPVLLILVVISTTHLLTSLIALVFFMP